MNNKIDVTISPSMTINTGDYESIKPSVSLTLKDVDMEKIEEVYPTLSKICQEMFMIETTLLASKRMDIKNMGLNTFIATWLEERDENELEDLKKELQEMLWEI